MTVALDRVQALLGHGHVHTAHGEKIGRIGQVYLDDNTGDPEWVTVKTGLFGTAESFVPLQDARIDSETIVVPFDKETVKAAPRIEADGSLTPAQEEQLYLHYGLARQDQDGDPAPAPGRAWDGPGDVPSDLDDPSEAGDDRPDISDRTVGYDRSGPTTDTAMTRSEERLRVRTQSRVAGRARLRKYVTTEQVRETVPVRSERVRVEREPITDANRAAAQSGPAFSSEEHEVVLRTEEPVVEKQAVPVERVRLDTTTVTEQATVSADLRSEHIELDRPGDDSR